MIRILALATVPVWGLLTFFYVRDVYEREPRVLLVRLFLHGVLITIPAAVIGVLAAGLLEGLVSSQSPLYLLVENFIFIALVEEGLKYWVVRRQAYHHPAFNEPYDGMLYAIFASLGFAALENILYVAQGGTRVAVARALLSVPAHALFASTMGYFLGRARFARTARREEQMLRAALVLPVLLHGVYDLLLSTGNVSLMWGIVPFSLAMWIMALRQMRLSHRRSPFRAAAEQELPGEDEK
ncbi:MAG: PrsW family glutamic-type intramembrane protease [Bacillota bacterium]|jgi:RsiW-degrading membrane proteinase PrsW (M82 family)